MKSYIIFKRSKEGIGQGGPIDGFDISVYHVETDFLLGEDATSKNFIWPICLPKNEDQITADKTKGLLFGWLDTPPLQQRDSTEFGRPGTDNQPEFVLRSGFYPRLSILERHDKCQDPEPQRGRGVNTFYPQGTTCYVDPSFCK